ncbi:DNA methyltransferase [Streptomyces phage Circinus]|uniref:DNA methyltransferase n=1 Tax=Streptomyces phage Circinus TaxID=2562189 RepID=A0A4D6E117_9CAUD|nr:DNA methyltransferase [Streptomyces phage Circinus]
MKLLDLFCGAGGASTGYHQAGFEVTGVDISHQKRYPFEFIQADVRDLTSEFFAGYDVIAASPPCQKYSDLAKQTKREYPDLIKEVRDILRSTAKPYVIENVDTAPLEDPIMLCGTMFPGLRVYRHRKFESNLILTAPQHPKHVAKVYTYDRRKHHFGQALTSDMFVQVTGGGNAPVKVKGEAMGIDWMINKELNEAIPPAYTKFIGDQVWQILTAS